MNHRILVSIALGLSLGATSFGQQAEPILREGDPLPAVGPGFTATSLLNAAVNGVGGYSMTVTASDGVSTLSSIWGNATGGPIGLIQLEGTVGSLDQTSFES